MKNLFLDENAAGNATFLAIIVFVTILFTGATSNIFTYGVNIVLDVHNINVDAAIATEQTASNLIFAKNVFRMLGLITLIGVFIWAKTRSGLDDNYVDATLLLGGAVTMYIITFYSMILTLSLGMSLDMMIPILNSAVSFVPGSAWEAASDVSRPVAIVYFLCQLPMVAGIIIYLLAAIRKTSGQTYDVSSYQLNGVD